MKRENNIYWKDYVERLEEAGITPKQEVEDVFEAVSGMTGEFYDKFREHLKTVIEWMDLREDRRQGRKKVRFSDYMTETICMPIEHSNGIYRNYPTVEKPLGNGMFMETKKLPKRVSEEMKILHWCHLELETVQWRLLGW